MFASTEADEHEWRRKMNQERQKEMLGTSQMVTFETRPMWVYGGTIDSEHFSVHIQHGWLNDHEHMTAPRYGWGERSPLK